MSQPSDHEIDVFNVALELPTAERVAYLDQFCVGDVVLLQHVEELLQASAESYACLENPATGQPGRTVRVELSPSEKAGDKIDHYKLLQQIYSGAK
jgi:hypothetical protein